MKHLLALLLSVMSGAALAQTTGAVNPNAAPAQPSVNEDVPPVGCMPIGLTTSGEIVFPIQCKEFIERHRGVAVGQKPDAVEEKKNAGEERTAAQTRWVAGGEEPPRCGRQEPRRGREVRRKATGRSAARDRQTSRKTG